MSKLEMVKEFRRTMGLPVADKPVTLSPEIIAHHGRMISDEADEILEAIRPDGTVDKLKARDVCADLVYFALGIVAEAGLKEPDEGWMLIHALDFTMATTGDDAQCLRDIHKEIKLYCDEITSPEYSLLVSACAIIIAALAIDIIIRESARFDADFAAVHAANMAKLWSEDQCAEKMSGAGQVHRIKDAGVYYEDSQGRWDFSPVDGDLWVVRLNGKVQKPPGWVPAVLEGGAV